MEKYIGIKFVEAEPMTAGEAIEKGYLRFNTGDVRPADEVEGYHVHYTDNDYDSWCPKEVFEANNNLVVNKELAETAKLMVSPDYKERFIAEYRQLSNRYNGLKRMYDNWDNLQFTPTCAKEVYNRQLEAMQSYLDILIERATEEGINEVCTCFPA